MRVTRGHGWAWGAGLALAAAATQVGHAEARAAEDQPRAHVEVFRFGLVGARLGVMLEDVSAAEASRLKLAEERGALVTKVDKDSAAEKAGIREGDVILSWQGEKVSSVAQLRRLVRETPPGRQVAIEVSRGGAVQRLTAGLPEDRDGGVAWNDDDTFHLEAPVPPIPPIPPLPPLDGLLDDREHGRRFLFRDRQVEGRPGRLGLSYQEVSGQLARYFKVEDGALLVTEVEADGPAAKAGLRAGDVIVNVEGRTDELSEGLRRALDSAASGAGVALGVQREGHRVEMKVVPRGEGRAVRAPRKTI